MARFMRKGKTKLYFVPTIVSLAAPTAAEVNGGTRLDTSLAEINGFSFANNPIDVPDMSTTLVAKINGEDQVADSSMVFYEDDTSTTISTALAKAAIGNIVILYKGTAGASPAAADKADVWPVVVGSNARLYSTGNEAAKFQVSFTCTAAPTAATLA